MVIALFAVDRKSTRLNSSHLRISYAVFCLKKKTESFSLPPQLTILDQADAADLLDRLGRADRRRDVPRHRAQHHPPASGVVLFFLKIRQPRKCRLLPPDGPSPP